MMPHRMPLWRSFRGLIEDPLSPSPQGGRGWAAHWPTFLSLSLLIPAHWLGWKRWHILYSPPPQKTTKKKHLLTPEHKTTLKLVGWGIENKLKFSYILIYSFDHSLTLNQTPMGLVSLRVCFHFAHILRQDIHKKSDNNTNAVEEIALPKSFTLN